jgi:hypothetical protein
MSDEDDGSSGEDHWMHVEDDRESFESGEASDDERVMGAD